MTNSLLCCINFFHRIYFYPVLSLPPTLSRSSRSPYPHSFKFFLSAFLKNNKTNQKNQNRQTKKWKKINVADNTQTKQKHTQKNMFYIYQLLLGMRPALQYGWYPQWHTEVNWFTFPRRYQMQIISWLRAWLCVYSILLVFFILNEIKDSIANEVIKQKKKKNKKKLWEMLWWKQ